MLEFIYIDSAIKRRLDLLRRSGKRAALVAARTEALISRLKSGAIVPKQTGKVTKHGEKRIKGVVKYDMGSGYRLVAYKQRFRIFLLYVGTHDDCHRWIENNRELAIDQITTRCTKLTVEAGNVISDTTGHDTGPATEEKDHDPLANLTDRELRLVFSGLVDAH